MNLDAASQITLLSLARIAMRNRLSGIASQITPPTEAELCQPAGCFVSLHDRQSRRLRGCVGQLDCTKPLWQAVIHAGQSVLADPRFADDPVTIDELPELDIELSVTSPLAPVVSVLQFDPLLHGIYLTIDKRSGCFLPQVARETGWTREQLLERLCTEKLGLPSVAWQSQNAKLLIFTTLIIGPEPVVERVA